VPLLGPIDREVSLKSSGGNCGADCVATPKTGAGLGARDVKGGDSSSLPLLLLRR
jgi:hypothetical protein